VSERTAVRCGVLLVNLGTPESPTTGGVRRYLRAFLGDARVIDTPRLLWWFILNCVILVIRPAKVAKLYRSIWTEQGSPLMSGSKAQAKALQAVFDERGIAMCVELAMTYGEPAIDGAISRLRDKGCERILVLPLYPQYSATTTAAVMDAVVKSQSRVRDIPEFRFIKSYCEHPQYIAALASSVRAHWQDNAPADKLMMSFHGIPKRYADSGDPYPGECERTAAALAKALELDDSRWLMTYQSRFGPSEWLQPYTDMTLESFPEKGIKRVDIMSPAFTSDCLETLEELKEENRVVFMDAGGEHYHYIPAVNDDALFIECLVELSLQHTQGW
jgi:protoporphyrin/coproporphyrin ferrochelatase